MSIEINCDEKGCNSEARLICQVCLDKMLEDAYDEGRTQGIEETTEGENQT